MAYKEDSAPATATTFGDIKVTGDLGGTAASPTVVGLQTRTVNSAAPSDGYVLTWSQVDGYWKPAAAAGGAPTGSAGGDLSGTYPNPTVAKIQNRTVDSTAPTDGYVLTWSQADGYWKPAAAAGGSPTGSAGGDLSGTYPNPNVVKIQNRAVNSTAPTDGYVLTWSATDAYWRPELAINEFNLLSGTAVVSGTGSNTFQSIGANLINSDIHSGRTAKFTAIFYCSSGITGEIRLYNLTDGALVASSTLSTSSTTPTFVQGNVTLAAGSKIYEAQLRLTSVSPQTTDSVICTYSAIRYNI